MGAAEEARLIIKFCLWVGFALVFLVVARGKTFSMAAVQVKRDQMASFLVNLLDRVGDLQTEPLPVEEVEEVEG